MYSHKVHSIISVPEISPLLGSSFSVMRGIGNPYCEIYLKKKMKSDGFQNSFIYRKFCLHFSVLVKCSFLSLFFFCFNRAISELSLCFMPVRCVQAGQLLQILSPNFCFQWTSATVKKLGHPGTWIFCLTRLFWKNKVIQFLARH